MLNNQAPSGATAEVPADETYEAYEARITAGGQPADPSDATDSPVEDEPESKTAATPESADDTEKEDDETEEGDKPKAKRGGFQRRIDKLTARIKELESSQPAPQAAGSKAPEAPQGVQFSKPKPMLEDFNSVDEHVEALTDWKLEKHDFEKAQEEARSKQEREAQTLIEGWNSRVTELKKSAPDNDRVLESVSDIHVPPAQQRLLLESEHGVQIAYNLAKSPADLEKFVAMNPIQAAKYLGSVEAALATDPTPKKPMASATEARRPPTNVGARRTAASIQNPYDDAGSGDFEKWEAARTAQIRSRRK